MIFQWIKQIATRAMPLIGLVFITTCLIVPYDMNVSMAAESKLLQTNVVKGKKSGIFGDGKAYKFNNSTGRWEFLSRVYEPGFFEKTYEVEDGKVYIKSKSTGKLYLTKKHFEEDFENMLFKGPLPGQG